jgi:hypothetical protein
MAKVIIGIHGLANKPEKKMQADGWKRSIAEGLQENCGIAAATFSFVDVYWADLLYKHPLHNDNNFDFDALYDQEPYIPAKAGALQKYEDKWLDRVRADAQNVLDNALDGLKNTFGMGALADFLLEGFPIVIAKFGGLRHDPTILQAVSCPAATCAALCVGDGTPCQRHIAVASCAGDLQRGTEFLDGPLMVGIHRIGQLDFGIRWLQRAAGRPPRRPRARAVTKPAWVRS